VTGGETRFLLPPGERAAVDARLRAWDAARFAARLWERDATLWSERPLPERDDRLGWLALPSSMEAAAEDLERFAADARAEGVRHVALLGMGGSSLAPEVFQRALGNAAGWPALSVIDTTHPDAVRDALASIDARRALFVVSSKSGTTLETLSLFRAAWSALERAGGDAPPGRRVAAITDPGTPLAALAAERGFRRVFAGPPDVGGRYSALSVFGLLPAALTGADVRGMLARARAMAAACGGAAGPAADNPGLALGAALAESALRGRDKVTFLTSPAVGAFPAWLEQLVAESLGKDGKGIVPVADEPAAPPAAYSGDRVFVAIWLGGEGARDLDDRVALLAAAGHPVVTMRLSEPRDLGAEIVRWEIAVAAAGAALGVHPFDQPDVERAKALARSAMSEGRTPGGAADERPVDAADRAALAAAARAWLASARAGDYVAIPAFLAPSIETRRALGGLRAALLARTRLATTLGFGPRFLHSTGQLHKGGANSGLFLQIVDEPRAEMPVPETDFTFGALVRAQAVGDARALRERGRRLLRASVGADAARGLALLEEAIRSA
jgi:transaldolase/glucose-6-phosphate isomerase